MSNVEGGVRRDAAIGSETWLFEAILGLISIVRGGDKFLRGEFVFRGVGRSGDRLRPTPSRRPEDLPCSTLLRRGSCLFSCYAAETSRRGSTSMDETLPAKSSALQFYV